MLPRSPAVIRPPDSLPFGHFCQSCHVPEHDPVIATSRDEVLAIPGECEAGDEAGVSPKRADQPAGVAVPDLHGAVLPTRGDPPALGVRAECDGVDVAVVPPED